MINRMILRGIQSYEHIRMNGWSSFLRETIYRDRRAIVFEKDLTETKERTELLKKFGVQLVAIDLKMIAGKTYRYEFKNRRLKALHYLEQGYSGHALVKDGEIVGDIWYVAGDSAAALRHPDLEWLGIRLSGKELYSFDIFFVPNERGRNLSAALQNNAMCALAGKGYTRAYAYAWADNTPALWNTRVINKWREVKTLKMKRFLVSKKLDD